MHGKQRWVAVNTDWTRVPELKTCPAKVYCGWRPGLTYLHQVYDLKCSADARGPGRSDSPQEGRYWCTHTTNTQRQPYHEHTKPHNHYKDKEFTTSKCWEMVKQAICITDHKHSARIFSNRSTVSCLIKLLGKRQKKLQCLQECWEDDVNYHTYPSTIIHYSLTVIPQY